MHQIIFFWVRKLASLNLFLLKLCLIELLSFKLRLSIIEFPYGIEKVSSLKLSYFIK